MSSIRPVTRADLEEVEEPQATDGVDWLINASREFLAEHEEELTIQRIVENAVEAIPGCDGGGISIRRGRKAESPVSTDTAAHRVDELQYELGEGPCLDAIWVDDTYVIDDVRTETRWPEWSRETAELGIRAILSVRLATTADTLGCLNLYSKRPSAFDPDTVELAQAYAALAASALAASRKVTHLQRAVDARHRVGLAQGILMAQYQLSESASFELLRRYSQQQNVKLRDVASQVVESLGRGSGQNGRDGKQPPKPSR
jgi:GAF domain-containing protein